MLSRSSPARRSSSARFPFSWPESPSLLVRRLRLPRVLAPRALAAVLLVAVVVVAVDVTAAVPVVPVL